MLAPFDGYLVPISVSVMIDIYIYSIYMELAVFSYIPTCGHWAEMTSLYDAVASSCTLDTKKFFFSCKISGLF